MSKLLTFEKSIQKFSPFEVTKLEIFSANWPKEFINFNILQLSDLHFGSPTPQKHLEQAVTIANELKPDIILLTGDYLQLNGLDLPYFLSRTIGPKLSNWIDYRRKVREKAIILNEILANLVSSYPTYAIFGNHDYYEGAGTIKRLLPKSIQWLKNDLVTFTRGNNKLTIAGLDDLTRGRPNLNLLTAALKEQDSFFKILLSHNPDVVLHQDSHALANYDLILSGHTHGGQICLPGKPILTRTKQKEHVSGLSYFKQTPIYVSRGIGYGAIQFRLFCPPEMTLISFQEV